MVLTDLEIKQLKPRERPFKASDSGNLFLWITPSGGKIGRWAYRFGGKEKLMTLGRYPEVSLSEARTRHGEARKTLASRIDPMVQRQAERIAEMADAEGSFGRVAELWIEHWQEGKRARASGM